MSANASTSTSSKRVVTHRFTLAKYSEGRTSASARAGQAAPPPGAAVTAGNEQISWTHYTRPLLECTVDVQSAEVHALQGHKMLNAHERMLLTVEWRMDHADAQAPPASQSQSQSAYSQLSGSQRQERSMVLESIDLVEYSEQASAPLFQTQAGADRQPAGIKAVYQGAIIGFRYRCPARIAVAGDPILYRRFQLMFSSDAEAERFIRVVESVCPITPANKKASPTRPAASRIGAESGARASQLSASASATLPATSAAYAVPVAATANTTPSSAIGPIAPSTSRFEVSYLRHQPLDRSPGQQGVSVAGKEVVIPRLPVPVTAPAAAPLASISARAPSLNADADVPSLVGTPIVPASVASPAPALGPTVDPAPEPECSAQTETRIATQEKEINTADSEQPLAKKRKIYPKKKRVSVGVQTNFSSCDVHAGLAAEPTAMTDRSTAASFESESSVEPASIMDYVQAGDFTPFLALSDEQLHELLLQFIDACPTFRALCCRLQALSDGLG